MEDIEGFGSVEDSRPDISDEDIARLKRSRAGHAGRLTHLYTEIKEMMKSYDDIEAAREARAKLDVAFRKYQESHEIYLQYIKDDEDRQELKYSAQAREIEYKEFCDMFERWLYFAVTRHVQGEVEPVRKSPQVAGSVASSSSNKAKAKQLALAKLEFENRKKQLELQQELLKADLEYQKVNLESEFDEEEANYQLPEVNLHSHKNEDEKLARVLKELSATFSLPRFDIAAFNGNPRNYVKFMKEFELQIESQTVDPKKRLGYLMHYCIGDALKEIEVCKVMEAGKGFEKAKELLRRRFGEPYLVARAFLEQVCMGPPIKNNDRKGLTDLALAMRNCFITLTELGYLADLNSNMTLRSIVERLPFSLKNKWVNVAGQYRERQEEVKFETLFKFLEQRSKCVNDPVFGSLLDHPAARESLGKEKSMKATLYHTESGSSNISIGNSKPLGKCFYCSGQHGILACQDFKRQGYNARWELAKKKNLCYNCLSPTHTSPKCLKEKQCKVDRCSDIRKHHTLLHRTIMRNADSTVGTVLPRNTGQPEAVLSTKVRMQENAKGVYFQVVPVKVRSPENTLVETYALLDGASDICICTNNILNGLGIDAKEEEICVKTLGNTKSHLARKVKLTVESMDGECEIFLPSVWGMNDINLCGKRIPDQKDIIQFEHLRDIHMPIVEGKEIGLLIGANVPEAFICKEYRTGRKGEPIGFRGTLGWSIMGGNKQLRNAYQVNLIDSSSQDETLSTQLERFWTLDALAAGYSDPKALSQEDRRALEIMESSSTLGEDGHYRIKLPWKCEEHTMPDNKAMVEKRLEGLKRRLQRNAQLFVKYKEVLKDYLKKGYAREIPPDEVKNPKGTPVWYLPHHPVINPHKPEKVRVVFDCAATLSGVSLNSELLSGPDLMNNLVGVLLRFREEPIAVMGDIEAMFNQVKVYEGDCDALRFLWWEEGDIDKAQLKEYQMCVHLFGATSSPSCSSFALKKTALDNQSKFPVEIVNSVGQNFYVDDFLKSMSTVGEAVECIQGLTELLRKGGFHITKWISNNKTVLSVVPEKDRSKSIANMDLQNDTLPMERTLGVLWDTEDDSFKFTYVHREHPYTKRGLLSAMSSIYDPLGFLAPIILRAKILMQTLVTEKVSWDEEISPDHFETWKAWLAELEGLKSFSIPRCTRRKVFGKVVQREIHTFCDASENGYGCISYLRQKYEHGDVTCFLIFAKARVAPLKSISIPRLELQSAVTAVRASKLLLEEMSDVIGVYFWTDSTAVLQFIRNESRRFKVFVANRVAEIHDSTESHQWHYVKTKENPADIVSRGATVASLVNSDVWWHGPQFLLQPELALSKEKKIPLLFETPEELRKEAIVHTVTEEENPLEWFIESFSSLFKMKVATAWLLRFKQYMLHKFSQRKCPTSLSVTKLSISELSSAEKELVGYVQRRSFPGEFSSLRKHGKVQRSSKLLSLNPLLSSGILRVGGRLNLSDLPYEGKHPAILPAKAHFSKLIVSDAHKNSGHVGRNHVLSIVRSKYWILQGKTTVRKVLSECLTCKRWNQPVGEQQMANLPEARTASDEPVFSRVGIDFFGPLYVKVGRSQVKRYGCIFTCLSTRAIHLEIAHQLDSDSFINAFRRFVGRRGKPLQVYSDNGTNFVGAEKIMKIELQKWNLQRINHYFKQKEVDWIFNPPLASHMGGVWERLIRQVKKILYIVAGTQTLHDETLLTFMVEVESIMNSRPLTECSDDGSDLEPLTPNHFLLFRPLGNVPPGVFDSEDSMSRRRWKQVQYLTECFWRRWLKEYLTWLQVRKKWQVKKRNFQVGDLVLVEASTHRGQWPLGRILEVFSGSDGLVRSARIKMLDSIVTRPIVKLCLLEECC